MTDTIAAAARGVAGAGTEVIAVTSSMGPASIEGYYDEALAVPGLLMEIEAGERAGAQAAIIACFDDTGLDAARAMASIPVIGICEAALSVASYIAQRFTVVTTTERSRVPVEGLVQRYGIKDGACAGRRHSSAGTRGSGIRSAGKLRDEILGPWRRIAPRPSCGCAGMADLPTSCRRISTAGHRRCRRRDQAGRSADRSACRHEAVRMPARWPSLSRYAEIILARSNRRSEHHATDHPRCRRVGRPHRWAALKAGTLAWRCAVFRRRIPMVHRRLCRR